MLLQEGDLAQRVVWILETLYADTHLATNSDLAHRVLTRLGSGPPEQWGRFKAQTDVRALLTEHAKKVCHSEKPLCDTCELRKFCGHFRATQRQKWEADETSPTVVDLFCGAGGASLGFVQAGFKVVLAVDVDENALLTYRLNHPELPKERVIRQDLTRLEDPVVAETFRDHLLDILGGSRVDVVVGGPPCQGFSLIGTHGRSSARALSEGSSVQGVGVQEKLFKYDPRNRLYLYFLKIVEWLRPSFCVLENVPAMIRIGRGQIKKQIVADFEELGYRVAAPGVYNAVDYGVPQRRERTLIMAGPISYTNIDVQRGKTVTLGEAIRDLPPLRAGSGHEVMRRVPDSHLSHYAMCLSQGTTLVHNHVARPHMESDLKLYNLLRPGESIKDRPDLMQDEKLFRYRNTNRFRDIYKRQDYNAPSSTVIAHLSKDGNMFIHPEQARSYTVREAARVQSFPDDYIFCGSRTSQFVQVGNAVPPLFIRPFADWIAKVLGYREANGTHLVQPRFPV